MEDSDVVQAGLASAGRGSTEVEIPLTVAFSAPKPASTSAPAHCKQGRLSSVYVWRN